MKFSVHKGEDLKGETEGLGGEGEGYREGGLEGRRKKRGKEKGDRGREEVRKLERREGETKGGKEGQNGNMDARYFPDLDTWVQRAGT